MSFTLTGGHGSHKMRIIKANRELLEEEYDPLPLLKSVFGGNLQKYKSVAYLSHQFVTTVFPHFKQISKIPERRKRVMQFMDIAEYMIDAETLWGFIEDTANAFSVKKLRDDLHDVNSGTDSKYNIMCIYIQ